jgi:hypothetical protein
VSYFRGLLLPFRTVTERLDNVGARLIWPLVRFLLLRLPAQPLRREAARRSLKVDNPDATFRPKRERFGQLFPVLQMRRPEPLPLFLGHRLVADDAPEQFLVLEIGSY